MFRVKFAAAGVSKIYSLAAKHPHLYGAKFRFLSLQNQKMLLNLAGNGQNLAYYRLILDM